MNIPKNVLSMNDLKKGMVVVSVTKNGLEFAYDNLVISEVDLNKGSFTCLYDFSVSDLELINKFMDAGSDSAAKASMYYHEQICCLENGELNKARISSNPESTKLIFKDIESATEWAFECREDFKNKITEDANSFHENMSLKVFKSDNEEIFELYFRDVYPLLKLKGDSCYVIMSRSVLDFGTYAYEIKVFKNNSDTPNGPKPDYFYRDTLRLAIDELKKHINV